MKRRKIRTAHGPVFKPVMGIAKIFKKKPRVYNLNDTDELEKGIIVSNHSAASGPLTLALYFPIFFVPWGTHEMTEKYTNRWKYLYHVFYQQKIGYGKVKSYILATLFAIISKMLYNGMQLIPTYQDMRLTKTIKLSMAHLKAGNPVLIFPEDSNTGYHEKLIRYNRGFVFLSERYLKEEGVDLPIYPIYYHKNIGALIIGKKEYVGKLKSEKGLDREGVAEYFKDITNDLADKLFELEGVNKE